MDETPMLLRSTIAPERVDAVTGALWLAGVDGIVEQAGDGGVELVVSCPPSAVGAVTAALGADASEVESWAPIVQQVEVELGAGTVTIDVPGNVFGDGRHPTTSTCAGIVERLVTAGDRVLDLGCGSGLLAIVAARAGARVVAVDTWAPAVEATRANAERAGVADRIEASVGSIAQVGGRFDLVVANIGAATLVALAAEIGARADGPVVLSGLLASQADGVHGAYPALEEVERVTVYGWTTLVLTQPAA